jgi:hypothetical protein
MNARTLLLGLIPLVSLSCGSASPVKVNAGDQCFRCRRTIGDTRVAGEIVDGGLATKYRGPGCLAKYLAAHADETGAIFVTDFTTGKMFQADRGSYVPVVVDPNTGETDYRAYKMKVAADEAARELKTAAIDWSTVISRAKG